MRVEVTMTNHVNTGSMDLQLKQRMDSAKAVAERLAQTFNVSLHFGDIKIEYVNPKKGGLKGTPDVDNWQMFVEANSMRFCDGDISSAASESTNPLTQVYQALKGVCKGLKSISCVGGMYKNKADIFKSITQDGVKIYFQGFRKESGNPVCVVLGDSAVNWSSEGILFSDVNIYYSEEKIYKALFYYSGPHSELRGQFIERLRSRQQVGFVKEHGIPGGVAAVWGSAMQFGSPAVAAASPTAIKASPAAPQQSPGIPYSKQGIQIIVPKHAFSLFPRKEIDPIFRVYTHEDNTKLKVTAKELDRGLLDHWKEGDPDDTSMIKEVHLESMRFDRHWREMKKVMLAFIKWRPTLNFIIRDSSMQPREEAPDFFPAGIKMEMESTEVTIAFLKMLVSQTVNPTLRNVHHGVFAQNSAGPASRFLEFLEEEMAPKRDEDEMAPKRGEEREEVTPKPKEVLLRMYNSLCGVLIARREYTGRHDYNATRKKLSTYETTFKFFGFEDTMPDHFTWLQEAKEARKATKFIFERCTMRNEGWSLKKEDVPKCEAIEFWNSTVPWGAIAASQSIVGVEGVSFKKSMIAGLQYDFITLSNWLKTDSAKQYVQGRITRVKRTQPTSEVEASVASKSSGKPSLSGEETSAGEEGPETSVSRKGGPIKASPAPAPTGTPAPKTRTFGKQTFGKDVIPLQQSDEEEYTADGENDDGDEEADDHEEDGGEEEEGGDGEDEECGDGEDEEGGDGDDDGDEEEAPKDMWDLANELVRFWNPITFTFTLTIAKIEKIGNLLDYEDKFTTKELIDEYLPKMKTFAFGDMNTEYDKEEMDVEKLIPFIEEYIRTKKPSLKRLQFNKCVFVDDSTSFIIPATKHWTFCEFYNTLVTEEFVEMSRALGSGVVYRDCGIDGFVPPKTNAALTIDAFLVEGVKFPKKKSNTPKSKNTPAPKTQTKKTPDPKTQTKNTPEPKTQTKKTPEPKTQAPKTPKASSKQTPRFQVVEEETPADSPSGTRTSGRVPAKERAQERLQVEEMERIGKIQDLMQPFNAARALKACLKDFTVEYGRNVLYIGQTKRERKGVVKWTYDKDNIFQIREVNLFKLKMRDVAGSIRKAMLYLRSAATVRLEECNLTNCNGNIGLNSEGATIATMSLTKCTLDIAATATIHAFQPRATLTNCTLKENARGDAKAIDIATSVDVKAVVEMLEATQTFRREMRTIAETVRELSGKDKIDLDTEANALFAEKSTADPKVTGAAVEEDQGTLEVVEMDETLELKEKCKELKKFCKDHLMFVHTDKVKANRLKFSAQDYEGQPWDFKYSDTISEIMFRDFYQTKYASVNVYNQFVDKVCACFPKANRLYIHDVPKGLEPSGLPKGRKFERIRFKKSHLSTDFYWNIREHTDDVECELCVLPEADEAQTADAGMQKLTLEGETPPPSPKAAAPATPDTPKAATPGTPKSSEKEKKTDTLRRFCERNHSFLFPDEKCPGRIKLSANAWGRKNMWNFDASTVDTFEELYVEDFRNEDEEADIVLLLDQVCKVFSNATKLTFASAELKEADTPMTFGIPEGRRFDVIHFDQSTITQEWIKYAKQHASSVTCKYSSLDDRMQVRNEGIWNVDQLVKEAAKRNAGGFAPRKALGPKAKPEEKTHSTRAKREAAKKHISAPPAREEASGPTVGQVFEGLFGQPGRSAFRQVSDGSRKRVHAGDDAEERKAKERKVEEETAEGGETAEEEEKEVEEDNDDPQPVEESPSHRGAALVKATELMLDPDNFQTLIILPKRKIEASGGASRMVPDFKDLLDKSEAELRKAKDAFEGYKFTRESQGGLDPQTDSELEAEFRKAERTVHYYEQLTSRMASYRKIRDTKGKTNNTFQLEDIRQLRLVGWRLSDAEHAQQLKNAVEKGYFDIFPNASYMAYDMVLFNGFDGSKSTPSVGTLCSLPAARRYFLELSMCSFKAFTLDAYTFRDYHGVKWMQNRVCGQSTFTTLATTKSLDKVIEFHWEISDQTDDITLLAENIPKIISGKDVEEFHLRVIGAPEEGTYLGYKAAIGKIRVSHDILWELDVATVEEVVTGTRQVPLVFKDRLISKESGLAKLLPVIAVTSRRLGSLFRLEGDRWQKDLVTITGGVDGMADFGEPRSGSVHIRFHPQITKKAVFDGVCLNKDNITETAYFLNTLRNLEEISFNLGGITFPKGYSSGLIPKESRIFKLSFTKLNMNKEALDSMEKALLSTKSTIAPIMEFDDCTVTHERKNHSLNQVWTYEGRRRIVENREVLAKYAPYDEHPEGESEEEYREEQEDVGEEEQESSEEEEQEESGEESEEESGEESEEESGEESEEESGEESEDRGMKRKADTEDQDEGGEWVTTEKPHSKKPRVEEEAQEEAAEEAQEEAEEEAQEETEEEEAEGYEDYTQQQGADLEF